MSIIAGMIFKNAHYTAWEMKDGSLLVERNKKKQGGHNGCHLVGENGPVWVESIKTAIDSKEASMLCRALLQS
jgi:hypothetical protein